ncbi:aspartate/glutamate racemase family protein [Pseudoalteromonas luteoviolacea]|uniref:aspartate/glutamate racemase family protein n=1 Tax=Pseudoalteromonas luteoviolacea TaxID=43657 RepID=UPI001B385162|nr:amino acid racemase [Pseudoalteromonas luteoviolacea]MBQ4835953.1 amino acid racemase [Pseudoalteromonas luteoviolacea]
MRTIGIIGGVGPSASAQFYLALQKQRSTLGHRPHILLDSIPVPYSLEEEALTQGADLMPYKSLLIKSAKKLERGGADFITLPCNTLSCFIKDIKAHVQIPVLNTVNLTVKALAHKKVESAGLFATSHTIEQGLYDKAMHSYDINLIIPTPNEQKKIDHYIMSQVRRAEALQPKCPSARLNDIAQRLLARGASQLILGCTDLPRLANIPLIDPITELATQSLQMLREPQQVYLNS